MQFERETLLTAYRSMATIRAFEEKVHEVFARGEIPGFAHLYAGEEASGVGICLHLNDADYITSTHRGHGHAIAKGCDVPAMMAELYGKRTGLCLGKGGSMHIADLDKGMMGANGIVGGGPPLACGAAFSARMLNTNGVVVSFLGDGSINEGSTMEAMNMAKVFNLPVIFAIEDNEYAQATATSWSVAGSMTKRAAGFDIPTTMVDGFDFFDVHQAAGAAIDKARNGEGPQLLHIRLYRYYGHFEGDATTYRGKGEMDKVKDTKDCMVRFRADLTSKHVIVESDLEKIDTEITALIEQSVQDARQAESPREADLHTDVYVSY
ncbi:MAG: thiamine pyrophosphate-dependent dehydrogenase E1 component subunit alpha [Halomonas sp.]|nr:thiamine pyrophosphate-dependent dehydrogenase E1 component subunit alpha [Halomonas sp.]